MFLFQFFSYCYVSHSIPFSLSCCNSIFSTKGFCFSSSLIITCLTLSYLVFPAATLRNLISAAVILLYKYSRWVISYARLYFTLLYSRHNMSDVQESLSVRLWESQFSHGNVPSGSTRGRVLLNHLNHCRCHQFHAGRSLYQWYSTWSTRTCGGYAKTRYEYVELKKM
jgi:hypothetical protein